MYYYKIKCKNWINVVRSFYRDSIDLTVLIFDDTVILIS